MVVAGFVEGVADGADAAVHHVRGRDDVAACRRLVERLLHQRGDALVVDHVAIPHDAVLTMGGERVEGDVPHDADLGNGFGHGAHGAADQVVRVPRFLGRFALLLHGHDGKER